MGADAEAPWGNRRNKGETEAAGSMARTSPVLRASRIGGDGDTIHSRRGRVTPQGAEGVPDLPAWAESQIEEELVEMGLFRRGGMGRANGSAPGVAEAFSGIGLAGGGQHPRMSWVGEGEEAVDVGESGR